MAEVTCELLSLVNSRGIAARAERTGVSCVGAGTVSHLESREVPSLDGACGALTFACTYNVNVIADSENVSLEDIADVPVTVIEAGPCTVVQKKTVESDGYEAVQLGFGEVSAKKVNKAAKGHFDKADVAPKRTLREFRLDDISGMNVGDILKADVFVAGDKVDVIGTSKGKGYQGVIKRFGQHRLRESHGTGPVARHAGSNGSTSTPSRVFKGKRLPGHMGAVRVTVQNLSVVKVDAENNLIAIKGAIPGPKGSVVCVSDSVKA